jgi:flavin reductase (DIM6/NTAB) family NADH-FMN oxidoreductase RutF
MDPTIKKKMLRLLSNGVYIITSRHREQFGAATVTWLSQASFKPPLIMLALRTDSNVFRCLSQSGMAAVHVVETNQQDIAQKFFTPTRA